MRTLCASRRRSQNGFTLFEMLIALAVMTLGATIAAAGFSARAPQLQVNRSADALVVDLKRMRLIAATSGEPVELMGLATGYNGQSVDIARRFPSGVTASWNGKPETLILMSSGLGQTGAEIMLTARNAHAVVSVAPVSGRIARVR